MFGIILLLFLIVPIVEIYLIIQVNGAIGGWDTLGLLILISLLGAWLVRREGLGILRRLQDSVNHAELPTNELINGLLVLIAAVLMLTPGFFTDGVGLFLLLPPTRAIARGALKRRYAGRMQMGHAYGGQGFRFSQWTDVVGDDISPGTQSGNGGDGDDPPSSPIELGPASDH